MLGEAATQQLREQVRKPAHIFQSDWRGPAEIVGAHANVVEAGGLNQAHDVVGDLLEARLWRGAVVGLEFGQLGLRICGERRLPVAIA